MAAAAAVAVAAGGTHRPGAALGIVSLAVFAGAIRTTVPAALATGAMGTFFYAGFITGRHAQLAWHGAAEATAEANRGRPARVISLADARAARRG